uniref:Uncharacterized protein n=1 Tax=Tanacetum cinerariifolium TaxID=118510 RepID=A0A699IVX2_TANCI|nr:hypothetical protein [Tanacetum cinerariifolium]
MRPICAFISCNALDIPRTAHDLILEHKDYSEAISRLRAMDSNVLGSYEESYKKAMMNFKHHAVLWPVN